MNRGTTCFNFQSLSGRHGAKRQNLKTHPSPRAQRSQLLEKKFGLGGHCGSFSLLEALPAKHRAALCWFKWNCCFLLASGADCLGFHSLVVAPALRQTKRLVALAFAILAAFGFVLELLVVEEELFARGKYKI